MRKLLAKCKRVWRVQRECVQCERRACLWTGERVSKQAAAGTFKGQLAALRDINSNCIRSCCCCCCSARCYCYWVAVPGRGVALSVSISIAQTTRQKSITSKILLLLLLPACLLTGIVIVVIVPVCRWLPLSLSLCCSIKIACLQNIWVKILHAHTHTHIKNVLFAWLHTKRQPERVRKREQAAGESTKCSIGCRCCLC